MKAAILSSRLLFPLALRAQTAPQVKSDVKCKWGTSMALGTFSMDIVNPETVHAYNKITTVLIGRDQRSFRQTDGRFIKEDCAPSTIPEPSPF